MKVQGQIVDINKKEIFAGEIIIENGSIKSISAADHNISTFIIPGFIDAHIHIESSMLVPSEFAKMAVIHGTVATVSDPHEIANVLGIDGVKYMIDNGKEVPFKFHFGAPSCVPATQFESAGATIDSDGIKELMMSPDIFYLAEMMNYPGVINDDAEVAKKIDWAKKSGKPVDGHAPGLRGNDLKKYIFAGITTDHECFTYDEALEKLSLGMKVIVREGSAAKNFDALIPLLDEHFENMMFCSDDKHPDDLIVGHINQLCARAVDHGVDAFKVLQAACVNPVKHYRMNVGLLQQGDPADFIIVQDLVNFEVLETYINGQIVAKAGKSLIKSVQFDMPNNFTTDVKKAEEFALIAPQKIRVIEALEGQLVTNEIVYENRKGYDFDGSIDDDILKITVVNRYSKAKPAVAFIKNFGLKRGAIASSVAHDCHNIVAVGTSDIEIANAVNLIIENQGGISATDGTTSKILPLPIAGIISGSDGSKTAALYQELDAMAKGLGSTLKSPYMTLSFMALLVIPDLKLSDKGLFSGKNFEFVNLEA